MHVRSLLLLLVCLLPSAVAQDDAATPAEAIVIQDEPRTVDPAELVPDYLARPVTLDFSDASLMELAQSLERELQIPVLFDQAALRESGIPLSEPVNDQLNNEPSYLLLNRLSGLGLTWFVRNNVIHLTTTSAAEKETRTKPYPIGDLIDQGFDAEELRDSLASILFQSGDGDAESSMQLLGDVLFVQHHDAAHLQLAGLLVALRNHGRRTFVADPPRHQLLREGLDQNVTVDMDDIPLTMAVDQLSTLTGLNIRLDMAALRSARVREREPVSLSLSERHLQTVLVGLLSPLNLTWTIRDGVIWITTEKQQRSEMVTAVYDVRDLCANYSETDALTEAIEGQTSGEWASNSSQKSVGVIESPRPGTMIIRQTHQVHQEVLTLLQNYRTALANSKKREVKDPDDDVLTRFYRVQSTLAKSLLPHLPKLVEGWDDSSEIDVLAAGRRILSDENEDEGDAKVNASVITEESILIVRQKRRVHRTLSDVLERLQYGDGPDGFGDFGGGGGGFGGGGFGKGSGVFSIPESDSR